MEKDVFDCVMVYNADRLARDPIEHQYIRKTAKDNNITIILSAIESLYDTGDIVSQIVKDGLTKFESDTTRDRTRDAFKFKVSKGELIGGPLPFGYSKKKNGQIKQEEDEIKVVKDIFKYYKQGLGFQAIAERLPTSFVRKEKEWTKDNVKRIITNPFYKGVIAMNRISRKDHNSINDRKDWITGKCEEIPVVIPEQEWEYCFKLYEEKKNRNLAPRKYQTPFLVRDLVFCGICEGNPPLETKNEKTTSKKGKKYKSLVYKCRGCGMRIVAEKIHDYIWILINGTLLSDRYAKVKLKDDLINAFEKEVDEINESIEALRQQYGKFQEDIVRAEDSLRHALENGEKEAELTNILQLYRFEVRKKCERIREMIRDKEDRVKYIRVALEDEKLWEEIHHNFSEANQEDEEERKQLSTALRRAYLHLIDKIVFTAKRDKGGIIGKRRVDNFNSDYDIDVALKVAPSPLVPFASKHVFPSGNEQNSTRQENKTIVENANIKVKIQNIQFKINEVIKLIDEKDEENKIYDLFIIKDHF